MNDKVKVNIATYCTYFLVVVSIVFFVHSFILGRSVNANIIFLLIGFVLIVLVKSCKRTAFKVASFFSFIYGSLMLTFFITYGGIHGPTPTPLTVDRIGLFFVSIVFL